MGFTKTSKTVSTNDWCYEETYEQARLFTIQILDTYRKIEEN